MAKRTDLIESLFDSTDAIIYVKDEEGRFILVNDHAAQAADMSKDELIGKTSYDLVPKDEADRIEAADRNVRESRGPVDLRDTFDLPSGRKTMLDHKFPVSLDDYPNAVGGIAFEIDNE